MSFLATLQGLGLLPGGATPQPAAPQDGEQPQAAPSNPYGLDPAMMRMARLQTLGNFGNQLMALSQQMTPGQRAQMMQRADWTGGAFQNIQGAMEMQDGMRQRTAEQQKADDAAQAKKQIADMIAKTPPGRLKDAAMFFFTSGDYGKAGELLWKREKVYDPVTGQDITVDALGDPLNLAQGAPQGGSMPPEVQSPVPGAQPAPAATGGAPAPMPAPAEPVDQLTTNWRAITKDPSLTPAEARIIAYSGGRDKAMAAYQKVLSDRQTASNQARMAVKDQSDIANTIIDDRRTEIEMPQRVVDFAQSIEDTLSSGRPTEMRALASQVLFAKVLDPGSAFMTGEADLQQAAASWTQRAQSFLANTAEGTPLPPELVLQMRDISRQLGQRALRKLEAADKRASTRAGAFSITDDQMGGKFPLRWNTFKDPGLDPSGTGRREPSSNAYLDKYGD